MPFIDCKSIAESIIAGIKAKPCRLEVLYKEHDIPAASYILELVKQSQKTPITVTAMEYGRSCTSEDLIAMIHARNRDPKIAGIILLSPDKNQYVFDAIAPNKRVEGNDFDDNAERVSCAARACVKIIKSVTELEQKNVLIIGYGKLVGKPLAYLLMRQHVASVTTTHKYTDSMLLFCRHIPLAEVIVSAIGKPNFVTSLDQNYSSKIFIDAGTSMVENKLVGDIDPVFAENNMVTPVPGGVGPVTSALLLKNTALASLDLF